MSGKEVAKLDIQLQGCCAKPICQSVPEQDEQTPTWPQRKASLPGALNYARSRHFHAPLQASQSYAACKEKQKFVLKMGLAELEA